MSRQHSRSPLHSRTATLGRRDGYYSEQYRSHSDPWRSSENTDHRNADSSMCWDKGSSQAEEQVDHWAKFIEAIDRAEKRNDLAASSGVQEFHQGSTRSPRRLLRKRLSSPQSLSHSMERHQNIQSPGRRRDEPDGAYVERRYSRSSSPSHSQGRRRDRMERGYQNEEHEDERERNSYSERSLKSNYMEPQLHFKQFEDSQEEYTGSHRGFGLHCPPVIVEHDHGISKYDSRSVSTVRQRPASRDSSREHGDPRNYGPSRDREHPRSRDPVRDHENVRIGDPVRARDLRSHEPVAQRGHPRNPKLVAQRGRPRSHDPGWDREYPRGTGPVRHQDHPRSRDGLRTSDLPRDADYSRSSNLQRGGAPTSGREYSRSNELREHGRNYNNHPGASRDGHCGPVNYHVREDARFRTSSAESNSARASSGDWEEETHASRTRDDVRGQGNFLKGHSQHRNTNHHGAKTDFSGHETLKIKVDMSRPVSHSSHSGYSSERQLSLDLVNVGRQRLDFLPMLEHSGTFRETATHSGTFAQEIITLVHHVKESFFQGQGVTLDERFSNEQEYSVTDEFADDEQEDAAPVVSRPLCSTSADTQIFCKIGPLQSQRKPHVPAPGDLRYDLERKRQERLEGVKITIAGQNVSRMPPRSQGSESAYAGDARWSDDEPQQPDERQWRDDGPSPKRPALNPSSRGFFRRARGRPGPRGRRTANNGARW